MGAGGKRRLESSTKKMTTTFFFLMCFFFFPQAAIRRAQMHGNDGSDGSDGSTETPTLKGHTVAGVRRPSSSLFHDSRPFQPLFFFFMGRFQITDVFFKF